MSEVHRLHGSAESERRALFVQAVAQSFDRYVKVHGYEPDAIFYVLNGIKQTSQTGWSVEGESRDGTTAALALAACHLMTEVGRDWEAQPNDHGRARIGRLPSHD